MNHLNDEKRRAARATVALIENGMLVGLGSGSTVAHVVSALAERISQGLRVEVVVASRATEALARQAGLAVVELAARLPIDLTIDGADEVDPQLRLIKGGGGALLREKILAFAARTTLIAVDSSKLVPELGAFPLPVEVLPFAAPVVLDALRALGGEPRVRTTERGLPFRTDQDNLIVDCAFARIVQPASLAIALANIPGALEHGLFLDEASSVFVAHGEQVTRLERPAAIRA